MADARVSGESIEAQIARYRGFLLYKDRKELEEGRYADVLRTLLKRSRWFTVAVGVLVAWLVARAIVEPGVPIEDRLWSALASAIWFTVVAVVAAFGGRMWGRTRALLDLVEEPDSGA